MTDFTEKVKQNALLTFSIVLLASLALTFLILLYTGIFGSKELPFQKKDKKENLLAASDLIIEQITGQNMADDSNLVKFNVVKLPMLIGPFYDEYTFPWKKRGCDTIYMIDKKVAPTPAPLNASLTALFNFKTDLDFYYGNYIMYHPELSFDHATIDYGVASVYLTGKIGEYKNKCDNDRIRIQIEETAFQFDTVKSVVIYLNGVLYK